MTLQETVVDPLIMGPLCPSFPGSWLGELGCVLAANEPLILGAAGLVAAGMVAFAIVRSRKRRQDLRGSGFLVFSLDSAGRSGDRGRRESPSSEHRASPAPKRNSPAAPEQAQDGRPAEGLPRDADASDGGPPSQRMVLRPEDRPAPQPSSPEPDGAPPGGPPALPTSTWIEAGPVRFEEPPEGTLQLLPGRLEIQSGTGQGREIRFVRVPGTEPEVTLGRSDGPPYRHIQLRSPTVSRLHARLAFRDGRWTIRNESRTNPTVLNGERMASSDQVAVLRDGDRVEMGEVVFLFHQPEAGDRLPFRSSWYTDQGRRPTNQDVASVRTFSDGRELAVVCDGMGSGSAGGLASRGALETLMDSLSGGDELLPAVRAANLAVRNQAQGDPEMAGMGSTMVALLREAERYRIANVGDSRAYRIDPHGIRQITEDHSFVAEVVKEGRMSTEEATRSPWKNAVTRHLGAETEVNVDIFGPFSTEEPHLVVLCSDGVHSVLSNQEIQKVAGTTPQVQEAARAIGEEALRKGSEDNVTVVVLEFGGGLSGA